jgi:hypothetical protein
MDLPLIAAQGKGYSSALNFGRTVNLYPVIDPGGKHQPSLFGTPGNALWETVGEGPIRGGLVLNGVAYVVSGAKLYRVLAVVPPFEEEPEPIATELGTLTTFTGPVTMTSNGFQVLVADGGCTCTFLDNYGILKPNAIGQFYCYTIATGAFAAFTTPDIPLGGSFYVTDLGDFTTVDALAFATAESAPDDLLRPFADHGQLFLFGSDTYEVWRDDAGDFPFVRMETQERGLSAVHSVAKFDNTIAFLGGGRVYRINGLTPERASTDQVEESIARMTRVDDALGFTYSQSGREFYVLSFPTAGITWVLDAATRLWHERSTNGVQWRATCALELGGKVLIGDNASEIGRLLDLRTDLYQDLGQEMVASHVLPAVWADEDRMTHEEVRFTFEAGVGNEAGSDPQAFLDWSDDNGAFGNRIRRTLGKAGQRRWKTVWSRLGQSQSRNYRITISDNCKRVIIAAQIELARG